MLLFVANWFLPQPSAEATGDEVNRPVIRIASMQQPPERIVIDANIPMIPPPTLAAVMISDEPPPLVQSYVSLTPHATVTGVEKRRPKTKKRQVNDVAAKQSLAIPTTVVASSDSPTIAPPTRLSFANIISGQLVRDLFNLH
jgi:hypothetical protein